MDRPVRVLYISPVSERGGAEAVLMNILKFHDRHAFEPIVCFLRPGPLVDEAARHGTRVVTLQAERIRNLPASLGLVRTIRQLIRTERIDIVFGNMASGHVFGGLAALATDAKAVWYQHGIPSAGDPIDLLAAMIPSARIYCNSLVTADAQGRLPNGCARLQVVHPGIDVAAFVPKPSRPRRPVVATIARLQHWKGQDVLLRAARTVVDRRPDVGFLLIGDTLFGREPEYATHLRELVSSLGLSAHVSFAGHCDDVAKRLDDVDIVVHPHRRPEPFGLAIAEAMLMEKPVIASGIGGPAEFITNGESGVLIPPEDADALAQSILDLLDDPAKRAVLGRAGRAVVLRAFSMDRMIRDLETSYRSLLN